MKNLKLFLSLLLVSLITQFAISQDIAMVEEPVVSTTEYSHKNALLRIDRTGITEVSNYIKNHVQFPSEEFEYSNEIRLKVQISINAFGDIIDVRQVEGSKRIGKEVLKSLKSLKRVSPILINDVPVTKTILLPLIFQK